MSTSTIEWVSAREKLPDDGIIVLIFTPEASGEDVWIGYFDTEYGGWRDAATGAEFPTFVTHWAERPRGPQPADNDVSGGEVVAVAARKIC